MKISHKRYKEYRRFKHVELVHPFTKKKNVKFLKRNRFVNFIYSYIISIRKLQWSRMNEVRKLQIFKNKLVALMQYKIDVWVHFLNGLLLEEHSKLSKDIPNLSSKQLYAVANIKMIQRKVESYFRYKSNILKTYYKDAIISKELYFQENFPQELLSPHRKRRILTYIKRIVQPQNKKSMSYEKLKMDLLFIMTSRGKKTDILMPNSKIEALSKFASYYNFTRSQVGKHINVRNKGLRSLTSSEYYLNFENNLYFILYKLGLIETFPYSFDNKVTFKVNSKVADEDTKVATGDIIESTELSMLYRYRILLTFRILYLFLNFFKHTAYLYVRTSILRKLYILVYKLFNNTSILINTNLATFVDCVDISSFDKSVLYLSLVKSSFSLNFLVKWSPTKNMFIVYNFGGVSLVRSELQSDYYIPNTYLINSHIEIEN